MAAAIAALSFGGIAPAMSAAKSIGWDEAGVPTLLSVHCPPIAYLQLTSADKTYLVPDGGGVVTSFSVYGGTAGVLQLQLFRVDSLYDRFRVVGESEPAPIFADRWNTFEARIPAEGGDHIGLALRTAGFFYLIETGDPNEYIGELIGSTYPFPLGTVVDLGTGPNEVALNLGATVEADPDGDGWGSETQDNCRLLAGPDRGCPLPEPSPPPSARAQLNVRTDHAGQQNVLRQGGVRVAIHTDRVASFEASGVLTPGSEKAWRLAPLQGRLRAGARRVLKLRLTPRAAAGMRRALENGANVKAKVTIEVASDEGDRATLRQTIAVSRP